MLSFYVRMTRRQQTRFSVYVMVALLLILSAVWTIDRIRFIRGIQETLKSFRLGASTFVVPHRNTWNNRISDESETIRV